MERGKPSRDRKARSNDPRQRARSRADYPGQRARTRPGGTRRWDRPDAPRGFEPNRRADLAPAIPRSRRGSLSPRGIRGAHSRWFGRSERFPRPESLSEDQDFGACLATAGKKRAGNAVKRASQDPAKAPRPHSGNATQYKRAPHLE